MRPVTDETVAVAGDVIARSFFDDPAAIFFFPDEADRAKHMPDFWAIMARFSHAHGDGLFTDDERGVAFYLPPRAEIGPDALRDLGMAELLQGWGDVVTERVARFSATLHSVRERLASPAYWELYFVGVLPEAQGLGYGVALVDELSRRAEADGVPCYLETLTEQNVAFYEKRGYVVDSTETVPDSDIRVWGMTR